MARAAGFWRRTAHGVELRVRLTPKSARDALEGADRLADGSEVLKARVRAVPEGGKANDALLRLLAKALGIARSSLSVKAGATARIKTVLAGGEIDAGRLDALADGPGKG